MKYIKSIENNVHCYSLQLNGSLPNLLSYNNDSIDRDDEDQFTDDMRIQNGAYTNGYLQGGHVRNCRT